MLRGSINANNMNYEIEAGLVSMFMPPLEVKVKSIQKVCPYDQRSMFQTLLQQSIFITI